MDGIGVVGGGLAGLHLSLFLQKHSVPVTLYAERTSDEIRAGRLMNTAAHWAQTRARERELGVNFWDDVHTPTACFHFYVGLPQPLWFRGDHQEPGICIDQRVILPRLLEEFERRGGRAMYGLIQAADLDKLSTKHDLIVVCSGRGSLTEIFPRIPERSPYTRPQRLLTTALFDGISYPDPPGVIFGASPGHGELFVLPYYTLDGPVATLFFEAIPGGGLEHLTKISYDDDQKSFEAACLGALREHFPVVLDFVDTSRLKVHRALDVLQGAIVPTVRHAYARLGNGRYVMAMGDAHVVNDPLLGQGANAASHAAFVMGNAILEDGLTYDERFCQHTEAALWDFVSDVTEWNNYLLQDPLPMNVAQMLIVASQNKPVADAFATNFAHPRRNWDVLATPERTDAFLRRLGIEPPVLAPPRPPSGMAMTSIAARVAAAPDRGNNEVRPVLDKSVAEADPLGIAAHR
jgi:2-polyprenyl-6-methoxyphenol hydroxylase-like FAD-dependent oxidoreductase